MYEVKGGESMKYVEKLLTVKSIVTILLTVVVCVLALTDRMPVDNIYLMIMAFYFGTQHEKNKREDNNNE